MQEAWETKTITCDKRIVFQRKSLCYQPLFAFHMHFIMDAQRALWNENKYIFKIAYAVKGDS